MVTEDGFGTEEELGKNVFIVDDDVLLHELLEEILAIRGYNVVGHAYDGAEAVEMCNSLHPKPDIILMDYRMPNMNGISATREIMYMDSSYRILFISADESAREEALQAGALAFFAKPIRSAELLAAIENYMKQGIKCPILSSI